MQHPVRRAWPVNSTLKVFSKSFVFDPRPKIPFLVSAKRYWIQTDVESEKGSDAHIGPSANQNWDDGKAQRSALTLVFTHGAGFHKEHWEPVIYRLFEQEQATSGRPCRIQDMWSFDAPNHGDAAVMNEEVLAWGYGVFPWEDYARSIHAFLTGMGSSVDVDFSKRNLVAVGHSMGAAAIMLSTTFFPPIKLLSMHLFEPMIMGKYGETFGSHLIRGAEHRQDVWETKEAAYESLKSRPTWQKWDGRILRIFAEHGLRTLPTAEYPDRKGVTLKCTRKQEAATYRDHRAHSAAYRLLPHLMEEVPTHITYGGTIDFIPAEWHHDVLHNASRGIRKFASVTSVPEAGHLIVQTHPDVVADITWKSVVQTHSGRRVCDETVAAKL